MVNDIFKSKNPNLQFLPIIIPSEKNTLLNYLAYFYQSGALVFGGGHVVLPFLEKGFVQTGFISEEMFIGGYGMVQGAPGPLFSFAAIQESMHDDVFPRQLNAGHTHLYTNESIDFLMNFLFLKCHHHFFS